MKLLANCILVMVMFCYSKAIAPEVKKESVEVVLTPKLEEKKEIYNELHILHPAFRNKVVLLIYEAKKQGIELKIIETYRTPERQDILKRRKKSTLSGGRSKHQHYLAVDVVPIVNGRPTWHNIKLWKKVGKIGEDLGLTWGGRWTKLRDFNHFEWNCPLDSVKSIPIPDTVIIPLNY